MASKRQANFELLRIVAILMIIALHYVVKGDIVEYNGDGWTPLYCVLQLLKAFLIPLTNCFVLVSGYFLVDAKWRWQRIFSLLAQILFYSVFVPLVMIGLGMLSWKDLGFYDWLGFFLPIETEHYWFATAYLYLYIFAPVLGAGVRQIEKKTLQTLIVVLLLFFSVEKTVIPVSLVMDKGGYDFGWFLCLFLIAAYLRLYGFGKLDEKKNGLKLYAVMCLCIFALSALTGFIVERTGRLRYYEEQPYTYNHVLVLLASIGLFAAFKNLKIREGEMAEIIRRFAPYTFGVYLLHEHILIRYKWMEWLQIDKVRGTWLFIPHMLGCVCVVYLVGILADYVRAYLFGGIGKRWRK